MREQRSTLKLFDDSFDNWCIEHKEEIDEALKPFMKTSKNVEVDKHLIIYTSSSKEGE